MRAILVCAVLLSSATMFPLLSLGQSSDSSQGGKRHLCIRRWQATHGTLQPHCDRAQRWTSCRESADAWGFSHCLSSTETDLVLGQTTIPTGG